MEEEDVISAPICVFAVAAMGGYFVVIAWKAAHWYWYVVGVPREDKR